MRHQHPSTVVHRLQEAAGGSSLLQDNKLFRQWLARGGALDGFDELPLGLPLTPTEDPMVLTHRGREVLNFGTNNYFGATHLPEVRAAAKAAIDRFGVGCTASRLAGGTQALHLELESEVARLLGKAGTILFNTGYSANFVVLTVLGQENYRLFLDEECHASLFDAALRSAARLYRFRHNDPADLARVLGKYSEAEGRNIVVVDGAYSMSGSIAPLREIAALRGAHPFRLLVDEAHSFGVLGEAGLGAAEMLGVLGEVDVITGTFSKAMGSIGGFAAFDDPALELIRFAAPSYMYTAALPPPVVGGVKAALQRVVVEGADLRARLRSNCTRVSACLRALSPEAEPAPGPVFPVWMRSVDGAAAAWREAVARGVYVNLVLPPASPRGAAMLRVAVSASHTAEQIGRLEAVLRDVVERDAVPA